MTTWREVLAWVHSIDFCAFTCHFWLCRLVQPIFIGFAVSIALYLPTVFVGGGQIETITIEAVSLAANGSRGPGGVAAMLLLIRSFVIE